jgi:hypothetical protein
VYSWDTGEFVLSYLAPNVIITSAYQLSKGTTTTIGFGKGLHTLVSPDLGFNRRRCTAGTPSSSSSHFQLRVTYTWGRWYLCWPISFLRALQQCQSSEEACTDLLHQEAYFACEIAPTNHTQLITKQANASFDPYWFCSRCGERYASASERKYQTRLCCACAIICSCSSRHTDAC